MWKCGNYKNVLMWKCANCLLSGPVGLIESEDVETGEFENVEIW